MQKRKQASMVSFRYLRVSNFKVNILILPIFEPERNFRCIQMQITAKRTVLSGKFYLLLWSHFQSKMALFVLILRIFSPKIQKNIPNYIGTGSFEKSTIKKLHPTSFIKSYKILYLFWLSASSSIIR